jgi:hypothetical protein
VSEEEKGSFLFSPGHQLLCRTRLRRKHLPRVIDRAAADHIDRLGPRLARSRASGLRGASWIGSTRTDACRHRPNRRLGEAPTDPATQDRWPAYSTPIWDVADAQDSHTFLVDGRFRVASFVKTVLRCR